MKNKKIINIYVCVLMLLFVFPLISRQAAPLEIEKVAGNVYCLYGPGGNIGILKTDVGILVIDSKYFRVAEKVMAKISKLSPQPVKYLVNTHYHGDHTGGNEVVGRNAQIIAHSNCKISLIGSLKAQKIKAGYTAGITTFDKEMKLKLGDENVELRYMGPAHTAGDTIVVFEKAGVIHTGDLFFNGLPPYIDVKDGSDTGNWIKIIEELHKEYPDYTVIPGHGKVTDMKAFLKFADYLGFLRKEVAAAIKAGKTKEQVMAEINFGSFKDIEDKGFLSKKSNVGWVYDEMTRVK
ncbi:MAG: MBL fold metallo-hydrolase [Candidatus Aminicenantes bacterium]|nr:MBL fold metallo-hydrolase [Candidatus Aminicenantes bacterium]